MSFSHEIEIATSSYDPTCGDQPGILAVAVCHDCGALVDAAALDKHTHERSN